MCAALHARASAPLPATVSRRSFYCSVRHYSPKPKRLELRFVYQSINQSHSCQSLHILAILVRLVNRSRNISLSQPCPVSRAWFSPSFKRCTRPCTPPVRLSSSLRFIQFMYNLRFDRLGPQEISSRSPFRWPTWPALGVVARPGHPRAVVAKSGNERRELAVSLAAIQADNDDGGDLNMTRLGTDVGGDAWIAAHPGQNVTQGQVRLRHGIACGARKRVLARLSEGDVSVARASWSSQASSAAVGTNGSELEGTI
eukprot:scaffold16045_cov110-Isochrysis_galbana.AAC.9